MTPRSQDFPYGKSIFRSQTFVGAMEQLVAVGGLAATTWLSQPDMDIQDLVPIMLFGLLGIKGWADTIAGRTKAEAPAFSPSWMPGLDRSILSKLAQAADAANTAGKSPATAPQAHEAAHEAKVLAAAIAAQEPDWEYVKQQSAAINIAEKSGARADPVVDEDEHDVAERDLGLLEWIDAETAKYQIKALEDTRLKSSITDSSQLEPQDWRWLAEGHLLEIESWAKAEQQHLQITANASPRFVFAPHVQILGLDGKPLQTAQLASPRPKRMVRLGTGESVDLNAPIIPNGNFTWAEATRNGERIPVDRTVVDGIMRVARVMQEVRARLGDRPITVNSWYRDPATNRRVGGASRSRHLVGDAVDFVVSGIAPAQVYGQLKPWFGNRGGLASSTVFTHLDLRGYAARWSYGF